MNQPDQVAYSPVVDELFKARVDLLAGSGYLRNFSNMAMAMCAPFWWSSQSGDQPPTILGNGTICYVNTGEAHIGVTASHVYAETLTPQLRSMGLAA